MTKTPRRAAVAVPAAALVLAAAVPSTAAVATGASGGPRNLAPTAALRAEVRASFYDRYRSDPDPRGDFGVPAGRPESAIIGPTISHAGTLAASPAGAVSTWVVASICIGTPVACQDAGAFQVFDRSGPSGRFIDRGFELCAIPRRLAILWFPGGSYPLGTKCPAGR